MHQEIKQTGIKSIAAQAHGSYSFLGEKAKTKNESRAWLCLT
jgi:hypothetical protein